MIGIYFLMGVFLAIPGGALGARIGSKTSVVLGLALMALGEFVALGATSFPGQVAARVLAGTGGVLVNVLMAKMVSDWFSGREIATAMGIFVNSWPVGIAVGLIAIPSLLSSHGLTAVHVASSAWAIFGMCIVAAGYQSPNASAPTADGGASGSGALFGSLKATLPRPPRSDPCRFGWSGLGVFQRRLRHDLRLRSLQSAGARVLADGRGFVVSLVMWGSILSVPAGGVIADRSKRPGAVIFLSAAIALALIVATSFAIAPVVSFSLLGLIIGVAAGPIMALPAPILSPARRAVGMGVFFTIFYAVMVAAPIAAGAVSAAYGSAQIGYQSGAAFMVLGLMCFGLFSWRRRQDGASG